MILQKPKILSGVALKRTAQKCAAFMQSKVEAEQGGFYTVFDKWFARVYAHLSTYDSNRDWEDSVEEEMRRSPADASNLAWDFARMQWFLNRWQQGRFVGFEQRETSGLNYVHRFGTEFGGDVLLMAQGAPANIQWRGVPLMKNVFDFALYPMLLAELRPRTVFEVGSGLGASAVWLADHLAILGDGGIVYSVDIRPPSLQHENVVFSRGDCEIPSRLFSMELLNKAPKPWLVIEDAHQNVEAVLHQFHDFLTSGDYLVVEDSEVKREQLRNFDHAHKGQYQVDTKYTDFFGRNATCAADSIFKRV